MTHTKVKLIAIALFLAAVALLMIFKTSPASGATIAADDQAANFKAKCAACHTATASKFFDGTKTVEEYAQTILKGKKGEKPPYMPAFETKGMTEDEAKALATYMKSLKTPGT